MPQLIPYPETLAVEKQREILYVIFEALLPFGGWNGKPAAEPTRPSPAWPTTWTREP